MRTKTLSSAALRGAHGGWSLFYNDPRPGPSVYQGDSRFQVTGTQCVDPNWFGQQLGYDGQCWISDGLNGGFPQSFPQGQFPVPYDGGPAGGNQQMSGFEDYETGFDYGETYLV